MTKPATILFVLLVVGILIFFAVSVTKEASYCHAMQTLNPDALFHYNFWTGCLVNVHGFWMRPENVQYIELGTGY